MAITVNTYDLAGDAADALSGDRTARFLGGGTLLMRAINEGDLSFSTIVRTRDPAFRQIRPAGARIEIGAGATMSDIIAAHDVSFLHEAARAVGGPAVRNMATVGGNLFAPSPYGDFAVALLALGGQALMAGGSSRREVPIEDILASRDSGQHGLVAAVSLERPSSGDAFRFLKVSRVKPKGMSVMAMAAHLPLSGGRIQGARVAYGAMAPTPVRVPAVERALEGQSLDAAGIAGALAAACEGCSPATDPIASEWYRREVAPVHLRRLLLGENETGGRR